MRGWALFWIGLLTVVFSIVYAWPRKPLPKDASWAERSGRSYGDWKGSWARVMVPVGVVLKVVGLVVGLRGR
jgi:hypothetical protein